MTQLQNLFEPTKVGEMELKNRIVMLCANAGGLGGRQFISHFAERASGGAALLIVGGMSPFDVGTAGTRYLTRHDLSEEEREALEKEASA